MTRSLVSRPALLKLPHASECWRSDEIAAYSIRRSRLALRPFGPAPRGFFSSLPVARDVSRSTILSRNSAFYRVLPVHFAFRPLRKAPLLGFSIPLQRHQNHRLRIPRSHSWVSARVHGFSPPSRAYIRRFLSRLISSWKHSWGSPFRGFPSDVAPLACRRELPSCRSHGGHRSFARSA